MSECSKTRADGTTLPKIKYATWREADAALLDSPNFNLLSVYRCSKCGLWHIGRTRQ